MKKYIIIMSCLLLVVLNGCADKKEKEPENLQISISNESEKQEYKIISDCKVEVAEKSEEVSELNDYEAYNSEKSNYEADMIIDVGLKQQRIKGFSENYYVVYVGEQWETYRVN